MYPIQNQKSRDHLNTRGNSSYLKDSTSGVSEDDHTPEIPDRDGPGSGNPQETGRQPQYLGGFTLIPPNESRRNKIKMMAQKEEEDLQRWKETNRAPPVHLNPEKLGGNVTLAGAREKQLKDLRCSKLQKKLRKEELDKRKRQEEEEELQKMKAIQREKAERLEERKRQGEQRRREQLRPDHSRKAEHFLQRFERGAPGPPASSSVTHTSLRSEVMESKQRAKESKSVREIQLEHKRVNSAFLDKLEGRDSEKETNGEGFREAEYPFLVSEDFGHQPSNTSGQSCSDWTEEADLEPDYDWALMKLINSFPDCCRVFLEDILNQCNGDYEQASTLLISTLS